MNDEKTKIVTEKINKILQEEGFDMTVQHTVVLTPKLQQAPKAEESKIVDVETK